MCTAVAVMIASVDSVRSAPGAALSEQAFDRTPVRSSTTRPRQKRDTFEQMFEQSPSARYVPRDDPERSTRGQADARPRPDCRGPDSSGPDSSGPGCSGSGG